ncbi:nucleotidyltransferase family protein, partial [Campylobacter showae]
NKNRIVVDVLCLDEINFTNIDSPVVIMAGGLGTRLYPLTKETPKPMLLVNGKPILERIIDRLMAQGFRNFYISINYLGEQIKNYFKDGSSWGASIRYIEESKRLGTAGALFKLKNNISEPFVIMNGDIVTDLDFRNFLEFHKNTGSVSTMCLYKQSYQIPFGVVEFDDGLNMVRINEKPNNEYYVSMGIYAVSPEALEYVPENEYYDMPTLFQNLIDNNKKIKVFVFDGLWNDIGRIEDYRSVNL